METPLIDSPQEQGSDGDREMFGGRPDPAQESLTTALRSSFNVLRLIMAGLVVLYLFSGFLKIGSGEQGLVARLGKLTLSGGSAIRPEGLHFVWPDPIDEKIRLSGNVETLDITSFLFQPLDRSVALSQWQPRSNLLRPGIDGSMLTGDRNLSHAHWKVGFRIRKPSDTDKGGGQDFVTHVGNKLADAEQLLLCLTESAVVRTVASRKVEDVIRGGGTEIAAAVKDRLQAELNRLETGITITNVTAQTLEPPQVRGLTDAVTQAANEKKRLIEEARKLRTEILNRAAGAQYRSLLNLIDAYGAAQATGADADRLTGLRRKIDAELEQAGGQVSLVLQMAKSERTDTIERMQRDYEEFTSRLANYRRDPEATMLRMWTRMRQRTLSQKQNESFFLPDRQSIEIIINRNKQRAIDADLERYQQQSAAQRP